MAVAAHRPDLDGAGLPKTDGALEITSLSKVFPGGGGLHGVDLKVYAGTVHALLGQNGSGKSTLIKILAGVYQPDPGWGAHRSGKPFELGSPSAATEAGIRFIHQDLGLISDLDVAENLALGGTYSSRWWLSDRREYARARKLLSRLQIDVDPSRRLGSLSQAEQAMIAVARAVGDEHEGGRLIVLDEPTAALQSEEVASLFALIRNLRDAGNAVVFVTHRLEEVFEIADVVTVLRDGTRVETRPVAGLSHETLVEMIIGGRLEAYYPSAPEVRGDIVLDVSSVSGEEVHDVSLGVRGGEIVGLAGLLGSGYESLLFLLAGGQSRSSGTVTVDGRTVAPGDPTAAIQAGIAFAPADRKKLSAIPSWTLRENVTLPLIRPLKGLWISDRAEADDVATWLEKVNVRFPPNALFSTLSGGNQQRVVIARWLRTQARAFLLQEPTNGVDTGAKQAIYSALGDAVKTGAAVLISSSDAEELCAICDRVIVLTEGRVGALLQGESLNVPNLLAACMAKQSPHHGPAERSTKGPSNTVDGEQIDEY